MINPVADGDDIEAEWHNEHLGRTTIHPVLFSPAGNTDSTTGGTLTDWINLGYVTVPDWAPSCQIVLAMSGVYEITAAGNTYDTRLVIGTDVGRTIQMYGGAIVSARFINHTYVDNIPITSTGAKAVKIQAARQIGTGAWRADANSDFAAHVRFM
jgi:hypothetical protein